MPESIPHCPYCKQAYYYGGVNPALLALAGPTKDVVNKISDVSNQAAQRNYEKREKIGLYDRQKIRKDTALFNKMKKDLKKGKLPPNIRTEEDLWNYIQGSGMFSESDETSSDDYDDYDGFNG